MSRTIVRSSLACGSSFARTSASVLPSADIRAGGVPTPSRGVPARRSISSTAITGDAPLSLVRRIRTAGPCGSTRLYRIASGIVVNLHGPERTASARALPCDAGHPVKDGLLDDPAVAQMLH